MITGGLQGIYLRKSTTPYLVEGVVMLILLTAMMMAVNYQEETIDERVSFGWSEDDSTFEIIQKFDPGAMVQSNITNLNTAGELELVVVMVETSVPAMETGEITTGRNEEDAR